LLLKKFLGLFIKQIFLDNKINYVNKPKFLHKNKLLPYRGKINVIPVFFKYCRRNIFVYMLAIKSPYISLTKFFIKNHCQRIGIIILIKKAQQRYGPSD
jgi:hypothetical protein